MCVFEERFGIDVKLFKTLIFVCWKHYVLTTNDCA
jgi:hypothetical protein